MAEAHVVAICVAVAALALAAAVLGVVGEATKSKARHHPSKRSRSNTRFLATVSATAFVVGAFRSQSGERRQREDGGVETYYRCTVLVAGVFAGSSFLALLAAAVGIASYIALEAAAAASSAPPCWEERRLGVAAAGQPEQGRRGHGCPSYGSNKTMLELFEDEAA
uniref:Uncharacterized protein n=1 Tax=Oryza meridionalis TaxID=40149 RepID=A0A0E0FAS6_9ORYZ